MAKFCPVIDQPISGNLRQQTRKMPEIAWNAKKKISLSRFFEPEIAWEKRLLPVTAWEAILYKYFIKIIQI